MPEPPTPSAPEDIPVRGVALALVAAIVGAIAITVAGGIVTMTAGLVVIAGLVGWGTALALRAGGAAGWPRGRRAGVAVVLALAGVAIGQIGLWLLGREEGGVLTFTDYLGEVFGFLVPLELAVAAVAAWLTAR
jgi:hypothetical protein